MRRDDNDLDAPTGRRLAADAHEETLRRRKWTDDAARDAALRIQNALDAAARVPDPFADPAVHSITSHRRKPWR